MIYTQNTIAENMDLNLSNHKRKLLEIIAVNMYHRSCDVLRECICRGHILHSNLRCICKSFFSLSRFNGKTKKAKHLTLYGFISAKNTWKHCLFLLLLLFVVCCCYCCCCCCLFLLLLLFVVVRKILSCDNTFR